MNAESIGGARPAQLLLKRQCSLTNLPSDYTLSWELPVLKLKKCSLDSQNGFGNLLKLDVTINERN